MWVLLGEMFPNKIRGAALAVAVTAQWLANWLVTVTFPSILSLAGPAAAYAVYAVFAAISVYFVMRYIFETKGRTLEEMEGAVSEASGSRSTQFDAAGRRPGGSQDVMQRPARRRLGARRPTRPTAALLRKAPAGSPHRDLAVAPGAR